MKGLGMRVASGAVLLAVVLVAIWVQGLVLMLAVAVAAGLAAHEFFTICRAAGYRPWYSAGIALSLLLALRSYLGGETALAGSVYTGPQAGVEAIALALVTILALARLGLAWSPGSAKAIRSLQSGTPTRGARGWTDLGLTLAGAVYTGGLLGYAPLLGAIPAGADRAAGGIWLLLVLIGTAACDTAAYFAGSALGRHRLIPHVSPAKTWEGLAGGILGSVAAALALSGLLHLTLGEAAVLGLVVCAAAVPGDLCESLLKRAAGVKDSGRLIPGHGGILDRVDSILFVLLAVYWFTQIVRA